MQIRLLGPVELVAGRRSIELGPPQRRLVFAALAADAGHPVPVDTVIDRVWGDDPPQLARRALHAHIARLRGLLHSAAGGDLPVRIVRRSGGYLLDTDPDRVDLLRFRRLCRTAARPLADLREAVALWRGEPLAGLIGAWPEQARRGWRVERLDAVERWASAELADGDPAAVVGPGLDLLQREPYRESLVVLLMQALHAASRPADALDLFAATRERLAADLGTEPSARLRAVHTAILRDEPAPAPLAAPAPPGRAVPAQLPRDVPWFSGRSRELERLDALLDAAGPHPPIAAVAAITGTAGVGKTALALHWAHGHRADFPDGQLYVNLRGFDAEAPAVRAADAVRGFLDALRVPTHRMPVDEDGQAALYRTLLDGRRVLIVLDNARDPAQVRPLLPGGPGGAVVVTSRNDLTGLAAADGAHLVALEALNPPDARLMLRRRLGERRAAAEPGPLGEIIERCCRLPLPLAIVAARAAHRPDLPLATIAAELRDRRDRLDALGGTDPLTDLRSVFSWSYRALPTAAATLFRQLGLHPGPDVSAAAAASLAGAGVRRIRPLLAELTACGLLVERTAGRYAMHDLLRDYAHWLGGDMDGEAWRRNTLRRALDHYLHTGHAAARVLHPCREPIALPAAEPAVTPEPIADQGHAMSWFAAEHPVLLAAIDQALDAGFHAHTWQLAWTLTDYLDRRGHWRDWIRTQRAAAEAGRRLRDPATEADAYQQAGHAHIQLTRFDEADALLSQAMALFTAADHPVGQAQTHYSIAVLRARQGDLNRALKHGRRCLALFDGVGHPHGRALAANTVGWLHGLRGEHREALDHSTVALGLFQAIDDRHGEGETWGRLGAAQHHLGRPEAAVTCLLRALELFEYVGDRYWEADTRARLGDVYAELALTGQATEAYRQALKILEDLDHPDAPAIAEKLADLR